MSVTVAYLCLFDNEYVTKRHTNRSCRQVTLADSFNVVEIDKVLNRDLKLAGIAKANERGRTIDVHSLRHTCTWMQMAGVAGRKPQATMRHSSRALTGDVCTDEESLEVAEAIETAMPSLPLATMEAELVIELTGSRSGIVYRPLPMDDPTQRRPDITLAREKLDWSPVTALKDGLCQTIDYFRRLDLSVYPPPTKNRIQ